jgi:pseudoazurin
MKVKSLHHSLLPAALALSVAAATGAAAETVEVEMLNFDREDPSRVMVYKPEIIRIEPGDTVRWVSVDDFHNTASIEGMIPDGAEPWQSPLSEDYEVTFEVEGTYGYICEPHGAIGMVGLVLVGDHTSNLDAAKAVEHIDPVQNKFDDLFADIE